MPRWQGVLFDAGGVLVLPDPAVLGPTLAPYGAETNFAAHHRAHYSAMAAKARADSGEGDWAAYDEAYVRALGVPSAELEEASYVLGRTRHAHLWRAPVPGAVAALRQLEALGIPIGVVSNASGQIESTLQRAGICQVGPGPFVEMLCIVDSEIVGIAKPDPRIFGFGLKAIGLAAQDVLYVGDSVTMDVRGAQAAGLHPVLVDPYGDWPGADWPCIASLAELPMLMQLD